MSKPIRSDPEATEELAALAWYDSQREGLGAELLAIVQQTVAQVAEGPHRIPLTPLNPRGSASARVR